MFAAIQSFNQKPSATLRKHFHVALHGLAVEGNQHEFLSIGLAHTRAGNECACWLGSNALVLVRQKMDCSVHLRPQMRVRIQDLHFDLDGRLLAVGKWRNLPEHAIPFTGWESLDGYDRPRVPAAF